MKKLLFIIGMLLLINSGMEKSDPKPNINTSSYIFEPDSLAIASLMNFMGSVKADEVVSSECKCDKSTGLISYDGGTSKTKCECSVGGKPCGCVNCTSGATAEEVQTETVSSGIDDSVKALKRLYKTYYVKKMTASWCGPCATWQKSIYPSFEFLGIEVKEVDIESGEAKADVKLIEPDVVPYFLICTKTDDFYHYKSDKDFFGYRGSDFSAEKATELMFELDSGLHPNLKEGIWYEKAQKEQSSLNGKKWAEVKDYVSYLRTSKDKDKFEKWPLEKLSFYELKGIFDDLQAEKLGVMHGI
jgi:hypothetical protein